MLDFKKENFKKFTKSIRKSKYILMAIVSGRNSSGKSKIWQLTKNKKKQKTKYKNSEAGYKHCPQGFSSPFYCSLPTPLPLQSFLFS
jgi:hypothetical protein